MSTLDLNPIVESLTNIAQKKELKPKSAYQIFMEEKLAKKGEKGGECKNFKEVSALWKGMTAAQKEPYNKKHNDLVKKAEAAKKEFSSAFDKNWAAFEKHLEATAEEKKQLAEKNKAAKKAKAAATKASRGRKKAGVKKSIIKRTTTARTPARSGSAPVSRTNASSRSSNEIASLQRGLDLDEWEVRESTRNVGFFYYYNKKTKQSTAERPKTRR